MKTTDAILKYAAMQEGPFLRKDLLNEIVSMQSTIEKKRWICRLAVLSPLANSFANVEVSIS